VKDSLLIVCDSVIWRINGKKLQVSLSHVFALDIVCFYERPIHVQFFPVLTVQEAVC